MKTVSEQFVENKRNTWKNLRKILFKIKRSSYRHLTYREIRDFPRLYRIVCADLAEARMRKLSPDVIFYVNHLVGFAHQILYGFVPLKQRDIKEFFGKRLPRIILDFWPYMVVSLLSFVIPLVVSFIVVRNNPEYAEIIIDRTTLEHMEKSYQEDFTKKKITGEGIFALSFYVQHNITIAFLSFATGLFLGIGTLYFLIYNGITLGGIGGYIVALGYGNNFFNFICAHSPFELTGLVIAGAAGLLLGYSIINPRGYDRRDWLRFQQNSILSLVCGSTLLLFCAAIIEGNISPHPFPLYFKCGISYLSFMALIYFFFILPFFIKSKEKE